MTDDPLYEALFNLLEQQQWREADEETYRLMLEIGDRTSEGWLRQEDIFAFPCVELRTIDGLWLYHSNQRFGFSVQKSIYEQIKSSIADEEQIWEKFATQVGWCQKGQWLTYPELIFYLGSPVGHLPRYVTLHMGLGSPSETTDFWGKSFFSRMEFCEQHPEDWLDSLIINDDEEE